MWWALAGCVAPPPCAEAAASLDAPGPAGVSASEAFGPLVGTSSSVLVYADGSHTPLVFVAELAAAARACDGSLVADFDLALATQDGAFDERWVARAPVEDLVAEVSLAAELPAESVRGTHVAPSALRVTATLRDAEPSYGEVWDVAADASACGVGFWGNGTFDDPCP